MARLCRASGRLAVRIQRGHVSMSPEDIAQLSSWLAATDLTRLELTAPDGRGVRLERLAGGDRAIAMARHESGTDAPAIPSGTVTAPSPGTFLHHHPLRTSPLVRPGQTVVAGQIVGLLRIGPLLQPVRAPFAGRVEGFWRAHGTAVHYGTALVAISSGEAVT